ncbi:MAG: GNVR domain-containing protein, partial [Candidatus Theseobacter exili]|nr:GNVR domain-containing protein [Candidatus Theseobacter exili]
NVVKRFDLIKRYKSRNIEEAVKTFRQEMGVEVHEEGTITVGVRVKTPYLANADLEMEARKLSAKIANFIIQNTDSLNKQLKVEKAKNFRRFVEKRYLENYNNLHSAEEEFEQFQEKYRVVSLPEQIQASITAAAELKTDIIRKEIEYDFLERYAGKGSADIIRVKQELNALKRKYNELNVEKENGDKGVFLALDKMPGLFTAYARYYRNLKIEETIQSFILPQYEQAKIQEAKDTPTIQVLDEAIVPIKRIKPKRAILVIFIDCFALFLSVLYIFFREHIEIVMAAPENEFVKEKQIITMLHGDLKSVFNKRRN